MDNTEMLQKVVDTSLVSTGGGGILKPEQADRFIDYMVDQSVLLQDCRVVRMNAPTREVDRIAIGTRIARKATENTDDSSNADPLFAKITLQTVKIRLDWRLTTESLEDNIEGANLEDTVARLMATQLGNDLEDLYINGDVTSGDNLLKSLDGWRLLVLAAGHVSSATTPTNGLVQAVFNQAVKAIPKKFLQRRSDMRWYTSSSLIQDFLNGLVARTTPLGDAVIFGAEPGALGASGAPKGGGGTTIRPFGIPLVEVPLQREDISGTYSGASGNHGYVDLTFPKNRIVGIQREVKVYRQFLPKPDALEYTVFTRVAAQIENADAWVMLRDVKVL